MTLTQQEQEVDTSDNNQLQNCAASTMPNLTNLEMRRQKSKEKDG